jgi:hypothetical protein
MDGVSDSALEIYFNIGVHESVVAFVAHGIIIARIQQEQRFFKSISL